MCISSSICCCEYKPAWIESVASIAQGTHSSVPSSTISVYCFIMVCHKSYLNFSFVVSKYQANFKATTAYGKARLVL